MWIGNMEPLRERYGLRLGSPAVSSAPSGKVWLQDFFRLCNGRCNVDFVVLRAYSFESQRAIRVSAILLIPMLHYRLVRNERRPVHRTSIRLLSHVQPIHYLGDRMGMPQLRRSFGSVLKRRCSEVFAAHAGVHGRDAMD